MALPNGDLITTVFDPQMAYPVDKRMQVDTLNSRDSMSMFIRWEGMEVYVLENSKKYILQGGRSNEYWKENGTGSGTGGTTFVGQFETADLLPTSGRSAGDYAFVGTGDDFVQYNWDNISGQWVMAEGQTDMASEFFHIGYKTPLRRPVIFPLFPKDVLVETSGDFVFAPATAVARFIFVGEVTAIRGVEYATADREIKLVNRTGSDIPLRDKASGIPSGSGMDFGGTDYAWVNGSEITLKGNGTYWELAPNNQVAFSDHLDSVNADVSVGTDGLEVWTGFIDNATKVPVTFKELTYAPEYVDGRIFRYIDNRYWGDAEFLEKREFNIVKFGADPAGVNFSDNALNLIKLLLRDGDIITGPNGSYKFAEHHIINKGIRLSLNGSTLTFSSGSSITITGVEKSTHTVTSNYATNNGQNFLVLNNTTGILKGDLINVISTDLYDSSRTYNYKGGNFLVTSVVGNTVYFDGSFPFSMAGSSIEVKIYKPSKTIIENIGKLTNTSPVSTNMYGLRLMYCSMSEINNVNTENSRYNIDLYRCVGLELNNITTGHAKDFTDSLLGDYDAYGIALESCTNVTCNNVRTNSGQHGITTGGREVCFNFTFNDCSFKSENSTLTGVGPGAGFGAHANLYNATFNDCVFNGVLLSGNCTLNNCDLYTQDVTNSVLGNISVSDDSRYANFIFNDCRLNGILRLRDTAQVMTSERKYVGKIKFNNCSGIHLRTEVNLLTTIDKVAEIDTIEIVNCRDVRLYLRDMSRVVYFENVEKNPTDRMITMEDVSGRLCGANTVDIINSSIVGSSYSVGFRLRNCLTVKISNLICPVGNSSSTYPGELFNIGNLVIEDTNTTPVLRPFSLDGISRMIVRNSDVNSDTDGFFNSFINTPIYLETFRLKRSSSGVIYNYRTSTSGVKYNESIDGTGRINFGSEKLAFLSDITTPESYVVSSRLNTLDIGYLNRYIRFTYVGASSNTATIPPDIFPSNSELIGEVEGSAKTFVGGTDGTTTVALRSPDGQSLVAPTGSRFIIKFKSPNDALVTIIKPYIGVAELLLSPYDLTTAPDVSWIKYNIAGVNSFTGSPNDSLTWSIQQTLGNSHTVATRLATNRATGEVFSQVYVSSAWQPWVSLSSTSSILSSTATLNFPVIAIGDTATLTATVTGAALLDPVLVSAPASVYNANNSTVDAWVSSANTVTIRISNNGESSIDPEEGQFKIRVFK